MANLGTYILFVGWISFNASSGLDASLEGFEVAGRAVVNTILCPATSLTASLVYQKLFVGTFDLPDAHNALLAGLVAITACEY